jgi:hypothetical protein
MNCELYQSELERYREGNLPDDKRFLLEQHLKKCDTCSQYLALLKLTDNVINEEKKNKSNNFLATRIMSAIEEMEQKHTESAFDSLFGKVLKPVLITVTLSGALLIGIIAGNSERPAVLSPKVPDEMVYINDASIESLDLFLTE